LVWRRLVVVVRSWRVEDEEGTSTGENREGGCEWFGFKVLVGIYPGVTASGVAFLNVGSTECQLVSIWGEGRKRESGLESGRARAWLFAVDLGLLCFQKNIAFTGS
jgi:hypothetical protein